MERQTEAKLYNFKMYHYLESYSREVRGDFSTSISSPKTLPLPHRYEIALFLGVLYSRNRRLYLEHRSICTVANKDKVARDKKS